MQSNAVFEIVTVIGILLAAFLYTVWIVSVVDVPLLIIALLVGTIGLLIYHFTLGSDFKTVIAEVVFTNFGGATLIGIIETIRHVFF